MAAGSSAEALSVKIATESVAHPGYAIMFFFHGGAARFQHLFLLQSKPC
jgi:hypothetical protein